MSSGPTTCYHDKAEDIHTMTTDEIGRPTTKKYRRQQKRTDQQPQWQQQQEAEELAQAFLAVDELELGWTDEWQTAAIINSEALWLK